MRFCLSFKALLAVSLLAHAAHAATFQAVDLPDNGGKAILMSGVINPDDQNAFHALAETMTAATVITTGPGGSVYPALLIGSEIRNRGWATLVPAGAFCASACSMIWLAGERRLLSETGKIGFHAMSYNRNGIFVESHLPDADLRRWLTQLGYSDDTTATIVNTPSRFVRWLDKQELVNNGIATESYP